jgi:hypothetical protein
LYIDINKILRWIRLLTGTVDSKIWVYGMAYKSEVAAPFYSEEFALEATTIVHEQFGIPQDIDNLCSK